MKRFRFAAVIACAMTLAGCSEILSLNSPVADSEAGFDKALEGIWEAGDDVCIIRGPVDGVYWIVYSAAPVPDNPYSADARHFEGRLLVTGDVRILDIVSRTGDQFQIPAHMWARVWPGQTELRWSWLDSDWLKERARAQLATQKPERTLLITSLPDALRTFLAAYGGDDRAHGDSSVWRRLR